MRALRGRLYFVVGIREIDVTAHGEAMNTVYACMTPGLELLNFVVRVVFVPDIELL